MPQKKHVDHADAAKKADGSFDLASIKANVEAAFHNMEHGHTKLLKFEQLDLAEGVKAFAVVVQDV